MAEAMVLQHLNRFQKPFVVNLQTISYISYFEAVTVRFNINKP